MIHAIMFDLDGTLVQSEQLKALSYAMASQRLRSTSELDPRAFEAYKAIVGADRDVASKHIMTSLDLEPLLLPLMSQYGVTEPEVVLSVMRADIYEDMVSDPQVLRESQMPHTIELLKLARESACRTALATMSHRDEAMRVVKALDLEPYLDEILTSEDVQKPKPDPEIYLLAAKRLGVQPQDCIVLEDSVNGVKAGVAAGMNVIAVATPFTIDGLRAIHSQDHSWTIPEPDKLIQAVQERIAAHNRTAH